MADKIAYIVRKFIEEGKDYVIAMVVDTKGSAPRKAGAVLVMDMEGNRYGTVGGGLLEAETEKICQKTLITKEPTKRYEFMLNEKKQGEGALAMGCGGDATIEVRFIDHRNPGTIVEDFKLSNKAYIFGGGHVALALEPVLRHIDFECTIIDDREEYANKERFPNSEVLVCQDFESSFNDIQLDEESFIIIVTRGHMGDLDVLRKAIRAPHAYLGMIGSKGKNKLLFDKLREEGFTDEEFAGVYTPIGLSIKAETPEEIGVSIAAEMIKVKAEVLGPTGRKFRE